MGSKLNLINKIFGRLTVIKEIGKSKWGTYYWKCRCDCGNIIKVLGASLTSGNTKSCGCLYKDSRKEISKIHGDIYSQFYNIWCHLKDRCNNKKHKNYNCYGGRGITYDPRWENYLNFKEDMYMKYLYAKKQLKIKRPSIERIDVNGNYCKENCIFIDVRDQWKNKQDIPLYFIAINLITNEQIKSNNQTKFAKQFNLSQANISSCLLGKRKKHKNWKFEFITERIE